MLKQVFLYFGIVIFCIHQINTDTLYSFYHSFITVSSLLHVYSLEIISHTFVTSSAALSLFVYAYAFLSLFCSSWIGIRIRICMCIWICMRLYTPVSVCVVALSSNMSPPKPHFSSSVVIIAGIHSDIWNRSFNFPVFLCSFMLLSFW